MKTTTHSAAAAAPISMRELARALGVAPATVLRLERAGTIRAEYRLGRLVRFDLAKCRAALAAASEAPRPEAPTMLPVF